MSEKLNATYEPGLKPIIEDLGKSANGFLRLGNGSRISIDDLFDLRVRLFVILPYEGPSTRLRTQLLFPPQEWSGISNHRRRLLGMGLAYLVKNGHVPLSCINPNKSGTKEYRIELE